jgi:alkanesulfonate monooxygenase SsuD/methylene tetrahydromethanopterin reductase-like flavin-dependent oxidoreductase (luciferase family)
MQVSMVILPDLRWSEAKVRWREAQDRGFTTAWTYDHLSWRSLRDGPWLGAVPLLAAAAVTTSTLRIGTLVTSPNFRHPALLAKDVMTLDELSDGRLDLGMGSGGTGYDADVLGLAPLSPGERASRFAEFVDALDVLLREPSSSFAGDHYTVVESRTLPGCTQLPRVPFTVAAAGPKAMRVAARHADTWVTYGPLVAEPTRDQWFEGVTRQVADLHAACEHVTRDPATVRRAALVGLELGWAQESIGAWEDFCGGTEELGFTDVIVHWPRPHDRDLPGPPLRVFDEICQSIR